jgi:hypothetical protein
MSPIALHPIPSTTTTAVPKYLFVAGFFGRFVNNLNMLVHALSLARKLDRILLIPNKTPQQNVNFEEIFDWEKLMVDGGYRYEFRVGLNRNSFKDVEKTQDFHLADEFVKVYGNSSDEVLVMHSYTPYYQCPDVEELQWIFENLRPTEAYAEVVDEAKTRFFKGNAYNGVHLRKMEKVCYGNAKAYFSPQTTVNIRNMCSMNYSLVSDIVQTIYSNEETEAIPPLFVATDRQDSDRDKQFVENGGVVVDWKSVMSNSGKSLFEPALDFFMLIDADVFLGNSVSSFSSTVAMIRVAKKKINREIMSWPLVRLEDDSSEDSSSLFSSVDSFWKCNRFKYWCAKHKSQRFC